MNLTKKAQRVMNQYLGRVRRTLRHVDPAESQEIVAGLRAHIYESLGERGSSLIQAEEIRTVLSEMDAPRGFGIEDSMDSAIRTGRSHILGRLGFFAVVGAAVLSALALLLGATVADSLLRGGLVLGGILAVAGLGLGIAGWRSPLGKAAVICGVVALAAASFLMPARVSISSPSNSPQPVVESHAAP